MINTHSTNQNQKHRIYCKDLGCTKVKLHSFLIDMRKKVDGNNFWSSFLNLYLSTLGIVFFSSEVFCFTYFLSGFLFRVRGRVGVRDGVGDGVRVRARLGLGLGWSFALAEDSEKDKIVQIIVQNLPLCKCLRVKLKSTLVFFCVVFRFSPRTALYTAGQKNPNVFSSPHNSTFFWWIFNFFKAKWRTQRKEANGAYPAKIEQYVQKLWCNEK